MDPENGKILPFNENSFSLNLDNLLRLGCHPSNIHDWFWKTMDGYIDRALKTIVTP